MRAADVMQKDVIFVEPELPLRRFEEFLTEEDISGAPVVASDGRILGVASKTDIVRVLSEEVASRMEEQLGSDLRVEDVMTREVVMAHPDADVRDVARMMVDGHLHRVLVVEDASVVGIVTTFDLLKVLAAGRR